MSRRGASGLVLLSILVGAPLHGAAPPPRETLALADLRLAQRLSGEANRHALAGRFAEAHRGHSAAQALFRRWLGERHPAVVGGRVAVERWARLAELPEAKQKEIVEALHSEVLGNRLDRQGRVKEAEKAHRHALAISRKVLGDDHPDTADRYNDVGMCLYAQGKRVEALPLFEKALAIRRKAQGDEHPNTAGSFNNVASGLNEVGRHAEALPLYEKALAVWRKLLGEEDPRTITACNNVAFCLKAQGKLAQALPLYEKALSARLKVLGEQHPDTATSYNNVASCLSDLGRQAQALPLFDKALAIRRKVLGEQHPDIATSLNNVASCLEDQGKPAQALPLHEKALEIRRKVLGEEALDTAASCNNLASCLTSLDRHAEALPLCEKALTVWRKLLGEEHPRTAAGRNNVAYCLNALGKLAQALPLYEKALSTRLRVLGEHHPATAGSLNNVAFCLQELGRPAEALPRFERALATWRAALGEHHPETDTARNNVAVCLWKLGRHREAVRHWQAAAPAAEATRLLASSGGFDRAQFAGSRFSASAALAVGLARLGLPRAAFRHAEASLARGLLDEVAPGEAAASALEAAGRQLRSLDERLLPLLERSALPAEQGRLRDDLLRQRRALEARVAQAAAERAGRRVLPFEQIQRHLPADAALVLWLDHDRLGEHWACVVRRQGEPAWQPLKGSGPGGAWSEEDRTLPRRLYAALSDPLAGDAQALIDAFRKQRLTPLAARLGETGALPAARRLFVVPTGDLARVPVEVLGGGHEVSYAPSGTLLARTTQGHRRLQGTSLLALGDPRFEAPRARLPEPPDHGLLLLAVVPGGNAARAGLRGGDVLLRYGERRLASFDDLKNAISKERAAVRVWREGKEMEGRVEGGALGMSVDVRPAAEAIRERRRTDALLAQRGTGHAALPGTRWEVEAVARLLPGATTLLGSRASEQELDRLGDARDLQRFRLLHLATHGEANEQDPERSALILAQDRLPDALAQARAGKKVYDGRLTVRAIRDTWRLDADLVVLSACQTALGRQLGGEGMLGFAQALLQKGARSVVLSRWKVDDAATALLMLRFYESILGKRKDLKAPLGRAAALQEAKTWLRSLSRREVEALVAGLTHGEIRGTVGVAPTKKLAARAKVPEGDRPYAHPYYWAAFVLVGDPD
jgi:tetratricopeptide (TPR) repeat protein